MDTRESIWKSPLSVLGMLIGASLVVCSIVIAVSFYKARSADDALSVTGSARVSVTSDQVKWTASLSRTTRASALKSGYALMASDLTKVLAFYESKGIDTDALTISPITINEIYDYKSGAENREKEYDLRQTITLVSNDVAGITQMAKDSSVLPGQGILFQGFGLEYTYSKLPELRVSLLSDAILDAKARAEKLAEPSGQSVGALKSASLGVVQVMPANSVDVSDYGMYDTSNIDKEVMVTVRASFRIR